MPFHVAPAATQLALTEALWQDVAARRAPATVRWYGYDQTALVLGVSQSIDDVDLRPIQTDGVAVVKRTSGGTTVLANRHLLALDVALPAEGAVGDVVESYRLLGQAFLVALRELAPPHQGRLTLASPEMARADQTAQRSAAAESPESRRVLACFGVLSPYEVVLIEDRQPPRKLVGLSQIRKRGVVLYQAGVYVRFTGQDLARYFELIAPAAPSSTLAIELSRRVASLADIGLLDGEAAIAAVTRAIVRAAPPLRAA